MFNAAKWWTLTTLGVLLLLSIVLAYRTQTRAYELDRSLLYEEHAAEKGKLSERWRRHCSNAQIIYESKMAEECARIDAYIQRSDEEIIKNIEQELRSQHVSPHTVFQLTLGCCWLCFMAVTTCFVKSLKATHRDYNNYHMLPSMPSKKRQ